MTKRAPRRCPECGGSFTIDPTAETEIPIVRDGRIILGRPLDTVRVPVIAAFCNGCEFTIELGRTRS